METQSAILAILKDQSDSLYAPDQTAQYLGVTEQTLAVWRCTGRYDIPYIKVGRLVKYRKSDLDAWLEKRTYGGEVV